MQNWFLKDNNKIIHHSKINKIDCNITRFKEENNNHFEDHEQGKNKLTIKHRGTKRGLQGL